MNAQEKWVGSKSLALLRQGPFRRYIIGSLISDSGTWMQMMAQSWVMSGLTSKAILLGLVNFAAGLPALILAPVAGSLADRLDKRKILVATQIAQIIFAVGLGFLVMSGQIRVWHIVFFALLLQAKIVCPCCFIRTGGASHSTHRTPRKPTVCFSKRRSDNVVPMRALNCGIPERKWIFRFNWCLTDGVLAS